MENCLFPIRCQVMWQNALVFFLLFLAKPRFGQFSAKLYHSENLFPPWNKAAVYMPVQAQTLTQINSPPAVTDPGRPEPRDIFVQPAGNRRLYLSLVLPLLQCPDWQCAQTGSPSNTRKALWVAEDKNGVEMVPLQEAEWCPKDMFMLMTCDWEGRSGWAVKPKKQGSRKNMSQEKLYMGQDSAWAYLKLNRGIKT